MTDANLATQTSAYAPTTVDDHVYRRRWWTLAVLCMSLVVIGVDNTILNVALPTLVSDLHATTSQLQWIVDGYTLVFAGLLLTAGSLGDRFGRRGALSIGLLIFGFGSVLSATAGSASQLIATRCVMGIGAALIMPATLSIVTNVFTVPTERARAIAIWAGFSAMGIAIGPLAGGYLLGHFYWGSVFLVNVPIVILALIGGRLFVPTSKDPSAPKLDPLGALLSIAGLTALLWTIIEAPSKGWASPATLVGFGVAIVVLGAFIAWELHSDHPMLNVSFFSNPRFTAASLAVTLTFFALFGSLFLLTQYLQSVLGYSALAAGVRIIPFAVVMMAVAPQSAKLAERFGTKLVVAAGLLTVATGLWVITQVEPSAGYTPVFFAFVIMATGMALTMAPATESIMGSLPRDKAGVGSAVNDTTRQVGGALGVAIIGSVYSSVFASSMAASVRASGASVPADVAARVSDSIGAAMGTAKAIGGVQGQALGDAARSAFVDGMHRGVVVGAVIALTGALVALFFLPARAPESADEGIEPGTPNVFDGTASVDLTDARPVVDDTDDDADDADDETEDEVGRGASSLIPS
jgi:EmrB/QacA subfamily drug resistance transporter